MKGRTLTRAQLAAAVHQKVGLSRVEASELVEGVIREIRDALVRGENVKLSGFGTFVVRGSRKRVGRNPKTGQAVPIEPRRVLRFVPSKILKQRINRPDEWGLTPPV